MAVAAGARRRIALGHRGEARAVDVEREDPLDLAARRAGLRGAEISTRARRRGAHAARPRPAVAVGHEREVQMARVRRGAWPAGAKPARKLTA